VDDDRHHRASSVTREVRLLVGATVSLALVFTAAVLVWLVQH
jgi:hypothetical protein